MLVAKLPDPDIHHGTIAVDNAALCSNDKEAQEAGLVELGRFQLFLQHGLQYEMIFRSQIEFMK